MKVVLKQHAESLADRRAILEFIEWFESHGVSFDFSTSEGTPFDLLDNRKPNRMIDLYFGIDPIQLEKVGLFPTR